jgi:hypothetical protein
MAGSWRLEVVSKADKKNTLPYSLKFLIADYFQKKNSNGSKKKRAV